jgi:hypothetical protein
MIRMRRDIRAEVKEALKPIALKEEIREGPLGALEQISHRVC